MTFFISSLYCSYHFEVQHVVNDGGLFDKMSFTHVLSKGKTTEKLYGEMTSFVALPFQNYIHAIFF